MRETMPEISAIASGDLDVACEDCLPYMEQWTETAEGLMSDHVAKCAERDEEFASELARQRIEFMRGLRGLPKTPEPAITPTLEETHA